MNTIYHDRFPIAFPRLAGMRVVDIIHMKETYGLVHAHGVVAILESFRPEDPQAYVGRTARIPRETGECRVASIGGARDHGRTVSFFFGGLSPADVPIGSIIDVDDPPDLEGVP